MLTVIARLVFYFIITPRSGAQSVPGTQGDLVSLVCIGAFFEDDAKKPFDSRVRVSYRLGICDREMGNISPVGGTFDWVCYITDDF